MRLCTSLIAAAALACASTAKADTFTLTGSGVDDTFTLPASPSVSSSGAYGFTFASVPVDKNGVQVTDQIIFFNKADGGGLLLEDASSNDVNPFGPVLYTGAATAPTFKTGTFTLDDLSSSYDLTISNSASTPEPGSIWLLSTGLIAAGATFVRRPPRRC